MRITGTVLSVEKETWFKGSKDQRDVKMLNLLDRSKHHTDGEPRMKNTYDFTVDREDSDIDLDKLVGVEVGLMCSKATVSDGSRLRLTGRILREKLPAGAVGSPPAVTTTGK